jgi:hypothetical protein
MATTYQEKCLIVVLAQDDYKSAFSSFIVPREVTSFIVRLLSHVTIETVIDNFLSSGEYVIVKFYVRIRDPFDCLDINSDDIAIDYGPSEENEMCIHHTNLSSSSSSHEDEEEEEEEERILSFVEKRMVETGNMISNNVVEKKYLFWVLNYYPHIPYSRIPQHIETNMRENRKWVNFIDNSEWIEVCYNGEKLRVEQSIVTSLRNERLRTISSKVTNVIQSNVVQKSYQTISSFWTTYRNTIKRILCRLMTMHMIYCLYALYPNGREIMFMLLNYWLCMIWLN